MANQAQTTWEYCKDQPKPLPTKHSPRVNSSFPRLPKTAKQALETPSESD